MYIPKVIVIWYESGPFFCLYYQGVLRKNHPSFQKYWIIIIIQWIVIRPIMTMCQVVHYGWESFIQIPLAIIVTAVFTEMWRLSNWTEQWLYPRSRRTFVAGGKRRLLCWVFGGHWGKQPVSAKLLAICVDGFPTDALGTRDWLRDDAHCALAMTLHQLMGCLCVWRSGQRPPQPLQCLLLLRSVLKLNNQNRQGIRTCPTDLFSQQLVCKNDDVTIWNLS